MLKFDQVKYYHNYNFKEQGTRIVTFWFTIFNLDIGEHLVFLKGEVLFHESILSTTVPQIQNEVVKKSANENQIITSFYSHIFLFSIFTDSYSLFSHIYILYSLSTQIYIFYCYRYILSILTDFYSLFSQISIELYSHFSPIYIFYSHMFLFSILTYFCSPFSQIFILISHIFPPSIITYFYSLFSHVYKSSWINVLTFSSSSP